MAIAQGEISGEKSIVTATGRKRATKKKAKKATTRADEAFDWPVERRRVLAGLARVLGREEAAMEQGLARLALDATALIVGSDQAAARDAEVRGSAAAVWTAAAAKHGEAEYATSTLMRLLTTYEHCATLVAAYFKTGPPAAMLGGVLGEIIALPPASLAHGDAKVARHMAAFLPAVGEACPDGVLPHMSALLRHLDGESYMMRNGVVLLIGRLVSSGTFAAPDAEAVPGRATTAMRDSLHQVLLDRCRDVTSFTRARALQAWTQLVTEGRVPRALWNPVVARAVDRLQDKAAAVRKAALQLLGASVRSNPYAPILVEAKFQAQFDAATLRLEAAAATQQKAMLAKVEGMATNDEAATEEDEPTPSQEPMHTDEPDEAEQKAAKTLHEWAGSALQYLTLLQQGADACGKLLGSSKVTDVQEAVAFFVTAHAFQLPFAKAGSRAMLNLVFHSEASVREGVMGAYRLMFFVVPGSAAEAALPPSDIADNLASLCRDVSPAALTCLEELLVQISALERSFITPAVADHLWRQFTRDGAPVGARERALLALTMLARSEADIVGNHLDVVLQVCFAAEPACWASQLPRLGCRALARLRPLVAKSRGAGFEPSMEWARLAATEPVFRAARAVLLEADAAMTDAEWVPAAEAALDMVFTLAAEPDVMAARMLRGVADAGLVGRSVFLAGHIALLQLVWMEEMHTKLKRAKREAGLGDGKDEEGGEDEGDIAKDLGLSPAESDDMATEQLNGIAAGELVLNNLLGSFVDLTVKIARGAVPGDAGGVAADSLTQRAAVLSLSKFMSVSHVLCERHLELVFRLLEKAESAVLRANVVVALSDLAMRWPNQVAPFTGRLYDALRDPDTAVRVHTTMVLTHLILNDMIKVKGHVAELAICLNDKERRIADLARLFFSELAHKGNALYNTMPDIISRLSAVPEGVMSEASFRSTMAFLFRFISKDRHVEALVDKLCHRFRGSDEPRHWRDIAFCLALPSYSDRSFKQLADLFKSYRHQLSDAGVHESFKGLAAKAAKTLKSSAATELLADWEQRLDAARNELLGIDEGDADAAKSENAPPSVAAKAATGKTLLAAKADNAQRRSTRAMR